MTNAPTLQQSRLSSVPRQTAIPAIAIICFGLLALLFGPPHQIQDNPSLTVARCVFVGVMAVLGYRLFVSLPKVSVLWRGLAALVFAATLKASVFPYVFRGLNSLSPLALLNSRGPAGMSGPVSFVENFLFYVVGVVGVVLVWAVILSPFIAWLIVRRRAIQAPYRADQYREKVFAETGYRSGVAWKGLARSPAKPGVSILSDKYRQDEADRKNHNLGDLVTPHFLAMRSKMPPFLLWYQQGYHDQKKTDDHRWVSMVDGNPRLAGATADMPVCIQVLFTDTTELALFEITAADAKQLIHGPTRQVAVPARQLPGGESTTLTVQGGVPGGVFPPAPTPVSDTHGSRKEGDGGDQRHSN